jgi:hypothetical protein
MYVVIHGAEGIELKASERPAHTVPINVPAKYTDPFQTLHLSDTCYRHMFNTETESSGC